jgi:hypothetical protein
MLPVSHWHTPIWQGVRNAQTIYLPLVTSKRASYLASLPRTSTVSIIPCQQATTLPLRIISQCDVVAQSKSCRSAGVPTADMPKKCGLGARAPIAFRLSTMLSHATRAWKRNLRKARWQVQPQSIIVDDQFARKGAPLGLAFG